MKEKLIEIRDRIRAAAGPDPTIDAAVHLFFDRGRRVEPHGLAPYTSSIDACVGLMERVLPPGAFFDFSGELDKAVWPAAVVISYRGTFTNYAGKESPAWTAAVQGARTLPLAVLATIVEWAILHDCQPAAAA